MNSAKKSTGFIPVATSNAGGCLTAMNWQETKANGLAFYLDALLMKPGYSQLLQVPSLGSYFGWFGSTVIDATRMTPITSNLYQLRNRFDGGITKYTHEEIATLLAVLKPDMLVVSADKPFFSQNLPTTTAVMTLLDESANDSLHDACYLSGDYDCAQLAALAPNFQGFIQSDKPANDGISGRVYTGNTSISILDKRYENQHQTLAVDCTCPSCDQQFTRAYFHHLLQHTPLLAQRLLVQHNIYQCCQLYL